MNIVERAKDLAHRAHAGQVDKAGQPYIEHVVRVAEAVRGDDDAEVLAWLHDVLEDAEAAYRSEAMDVANELALCIELFAITRKPGQTGASYYENVRRLLIALRVKLADIADNSDEARLALLDEKTAARLRRKYAKALKMLTGGDDV